MIEFKYYWGDGYLVQVFEGDDERAIAVCAVSDCEELCGELICSAISLTRDYFLFIPISKDTEGVSVLEKFGLKLGWTSRPKIAHLINNVAW